ncbi:hypothetical protein [Haloarcula amylovorans]|uniref:hypothetical protein n=1 Tax=Haloarcula amylovorans TaxID=2562280 RepID=UPI0010762D56|nr:hypothetical protein [Halomicroarcula amylolytica]
MTTTNNRIREHFEGSASPYTETDSPGNGAATAVGEDTQTHVVNPDGTNAVDLDAAAQEGQTVTVVHNGGANTPTLSFTDADFVGTGPANMTSAGATATVRNVDGTTSGWVVVATGSA